MAAAAEEASLGTASPSTGAAEPSATHDAAMYDAMSVEDAMAAIAQLLQRPGAEPGEVLRAFKSEFKQGLAQQAQDAWKRQLTLHVKVGLSLRLSPAHCAQQKMTALLISPACCSHCRGRRAAGRGGSKVC
jgi:hypothetical protein